MQYYGLRYSNQDVDWVIHPDDYKRLVAIHPANDKFPPQTPGIQIKDKVGDRNTQTDYFLSLYKYDYGYLRQRAIWDPLEKVYVASKEDLILLKAMAAYDEVHDPPPPPRVRTKSFKDLDLLVSSIAENADDAENTDENQGRVGPETKAAIKFTPVQDGEIENGKTDQDGKESRELKKQKQIVIREHGTYDVIKLQRLVKDRVIFTIPLADLDYILDVDLWQDSLEQTITPRMVLDDMAEELETYPEHEKSINESTFEYPILVTKDAKTGKYDVLDGLHRLAKAKLLGMTSIDARLVTTVDLLESKIGDGDAEAALFLTGPGGSRSWNRTVKSIARTFPSLLRSAKGLGKRKNLSNTSTLCDGIVVGPNKVATTLMALDKDKDDDDARDKKRQRVDQLGNLHNHPANPLEEFIDFVQAKYYEIDTLPIDWADELRKYHTENSDTSTPADSASWAIARFGMKHTWFNTPDWAENLETKELYSSQFTVALLDGLFGYISIPELMSGDLTELTKWLTETGSKIAQLVTAKPAPPIGYVIDLSHNRGGNWAAMFLSVRWFCDVLNDFDKDTTLFAWTSRNAEQDEPMIWSTKNKTQRLITPEEDQWNWSPLVNDELIEIDHQIRTALAAVPNFPLAIVIGQATGSAAELLAWILKRFHKNTRVFGQRTAGVLTRVTNKTLSDGSWAGTEDAHLVPMPGMPAHPRHVEPDVVTESSVEAIRRARQWISSNNGQALGGGGDIDAKDKKKHIVRLVGIPGTGKTWLIKKASEIPGVVGIDTDDLYSRAYAKVRASGKYKSRSSSGFNRDILADQIRQRDDIISEFNKASDKRVLIFGGIFDMLPVVKPDLKLFMTIPSETFESTYRRLIMREYDKDFTHQPEIKAIIETKEPDWIPSDIGHAANQAGTVTYAHYKEDYARQKRLSIARGYKIASQDQILAIIRDLANSS